MPNKITVKINERTTFDSNEAASDFIKKIVDIGIIFFEVQEGSEVNVQLKPEEAPAPKPEKKIRGPYKKRSIPESGNDHPGRKFTKKVIEFLKQNCDTKDNKMLAKAVEDKFGFLTTHYSVALQLTQNGIKRKNGYHKKPDNVDKEEDLPTLPPENDL